MVQRYDLSELVSFLAFVGFWPFSASEKSSRLWKWFQILRLVLFGQMVISWILSAYLIGAVVFLNKFYSGTVLSTPFMLLQSIYIFSKSQHLLSFVVRMRTTLQKRKEKWEIEIVNSLLDPLRKLIRIAIFYTILLITIAFLGPLLYDTVSTLLLGAEPLNLELPVEGLLPSNKEVLYYSFQWYYTFLVYMNATFFIGLIFILPTLVTYIRIEMKILCEKIQRWGMMDSTKEEMLFKEIIEDHINIISLAETTNKLLAAPLYIQNMGAALAITLFLNTMMNTISQDNYNEILFNLNSPFAMTLTVFLSCYCGELLHSESLSIYKAFCQIQWYNKPQERQKDLVINATYSYFMLLQSFS